MLRLIPLALIVMGLALTGTAFAQGPVDETLRPNTGAVPQLPNNLQPDGPECDDFNRPNGPMGGNWTDIVGVQNILNNTGIGQAGQGNAWMEHNTASEPYASADVNMSLLPAPSGGLQYTACVTGLTSGTNDMLFTKLQAQGSILYNFCGFYVGFNGGGRTGYGGFHGITPFAEGDVNWYVTNAGDTMNIDIDEDRNGTVDYHYESSGINGLAGQGVNLGNGLGIGTFGDGRYDDWDLNGGCGGGCALTISAGTCGVDRQTFAVVPAPAGSYALYWSTSTGSTAYSVGSCSGTSGLGAFGPPKFGGPPFIASSPITKKVPPAVCGGIFAQAVDLTNCCLTNVATP